MVPGSLSALRGLIRSGAIQTRSGTGRKIRLGQRKGKQSKLAGVKEYGDKGTEFEELRLARLFQRYLRVHLRDQLLRRKKNAPFTVMMKGFDKPLHQEGRLIDEFVYIRKMDRGYRVGFSLQNSFNDRMTVAGLLEVLEKGVVLDNTEEKSKRMKKWFMAQIRESAKRPEDLGIFRNHVKRRKKFGRYKIPPRPFFKEIAEKFVEQNKGDRREFDIGEYSLSIFVRKKPKVDIKDVQSKRTPGIVKFTELYG